MRAYQLKLALVLALALVCGEGGVLAVSLPDLIDRHRLGVVGVGSFNPTASPRARLRGTGFVVGDGRWVVTNAHVIPKEMDSRALERLAVFTGDGSDIRPRTADLVARDQRRDLVLLHLDGDPLPALPLARPDLPREGIDIAVTGFPLGMMFGLQRVTHRGVVAAITPMAMPVLSGRQIKRRNIGAMQNPYKVLQLDLVAYPGNSGSPVYRLSDGRVVGVVNSVLVKGSRESVLRSPTGITYAIPVRYVWALFEEARKRRGERARK